MFWLRHRECQWPCSSRRDVLIFLSLRTISALFVQPRYSKLLNTKQIKEVMGVPPEGAAVAPIAIPPAISVKAWEVSYLTADRFRIRVWEVYCLQSYLYWEQNHTWNFKKTDSCRNWRASGIFMYYGHQVTERNKLKSCKLKERIAMTCF